MLVALHISSTQRKLCMTLNSIYRKSVSFTQLSSAQWCHDSKLLSLWQCHHKELEGPCNRPQTWTTVRNNSLQWLRCQRLSDLLPGKSYAGYLDLRPLSNAHGPVSGLPPPGGSETLRLASQVSEPNVSLISSSVLMLVSCMSASTMDAVSRHL